MSSDAPAVKNSAHQGGGVGEVGVLFDAPAPEVTTELTYDTVLDWDSFDQWLTKITQAELVALDTETTSLVEMQAQIVGISVCVTPGEAAYIPLAHNAADAPTQLPLQEVLQKLKPWLEDGSKHKLGQHVKYDRHVFANHGIEVQGFVHDTMLQSYVLEVHKQHGLESLADRHLGRKGLSYEDLCGKGAHQISFAQVDVARASHYACEDADFTLAVHRRLWPLLQADEKLNFVYQLEIQSSEALYRIESGSSIA
jgi:DNA polymerase-1